MGIKFKDLDIIYLLGCCFLFRLSWGGLCGLSLGVYFVLSFSWRFVVGFIMKAWLI